jgi:hypothetical protein
MLQNEEPSNANWLVHVMVQKGFGHWLSVMVPKHHFWFLVLLLISVACVIGLSVNTSSTDVSFQNLVFWNLFQQHKSFKNQYLAYSKSKSYQINSLNLAHQYLSNNTKSTFQFL